MRSKIKSTKKTFRPEYMEDGGRKKKMKPLAKEKYKHHFSDQE